MTTINPTYTAHEVLHQLVDAGAKYLVTIGMFLETARKPPTGPRRRDLHVRRSRGIGPFASLLGEARHPSKSRRPRRRHCRAAVLVGHDRAVQGRDADAPQLLSPTCAKASRCSRWTRRRGARGRAAVLPHLRHAGADERRHGQRSDTCDDATVRLWSCSSASSRITRSPGPTSCRPIVLALAKHPMVDEYDLSHCRSSSRAAPARCRRVGRGRQRDRCRGGSGLRLTETSPITHATLLGEPSPAPSVDRFRSPRRGSSIPRRAGLRGRRGRRDLDPRSPGHEGVPQQPGGDGDCIDTTGGSTPATSAMSTRTTTTTSSIGSRSSSSTRASRCRRRSWRRCC